MDDIGDDKDRNLCAELLYNAMDTNLRQETILKAIYSDEFLSFVHNELIPGFSKDSP